MAMRIGEVGTVDAHADAPSSPGGPLKPGRDARLRPPRAARRGSTSTGRRPSTGSRSTAARSTTSTLGEGPALVFVHGLGASWQSWLEQHARSSRATTAWSRWTCPGSATRRCRARTSRSSTTRAGPSQLLDALGIESAAVVGNSMGGFVAAELAIRSRRACSGSCSCRAAIFWQNLRGAPSRWCSSRGCPTRSWPARWRAPPTTSRRGRGCATRALATAGFRYPQPDLATSSPTRWCAARGGPTASSPRSRRSPTTRSSEELPKISCPTLIVWGAHDTLVPVKDAERMRGADPRLAARGVRAHRPRGDARAAGALQPAAGGVPRRHGAGERPLAGDGAL